MDYYTMSRKSKTRRRVAPYKVWFFDGTFYLIGNCGLREDVRIFALDRISHLEKTDEVFELPADFDIDEFMRASFGIFHGEPATVKIWFAAEVAGYISEKVWHETQQIQKQSDGSLIFEAEIAGTQEIKFWIMNWGSKALVLAPESLRKEIRAEAAAMLENYGKQPIL